ncbi:CPBP family intramembrane metalloprotease (plasmid) [Clostridium botulinum]|uniref:CAAX prenyl protease 2/Lysostaphin resistance protein A-like domain-containing protein n=1 Tax=Clostridium botulinum C/D str. DC5 TaxID=1443128 RepID=A0A0A0HX89_CLOBO|nr:CPBP family intramembrane glutamic endopeptidase [Clostridium botulinum]MCD3235339.1 CPBP family intramembrane metalloprotease [Clostridium botulinum D/C]KEH99932.1 hypothetical protein Z952_14840 [Clostridium botulinum C/D str. BKT75002]KEI05558.1 hypothetical protein Z954_14980 [Clostridium botulinum C/D str. BKT2873]KGM93008.1 hypothetical protein Z955_16260 [Clostridium botulinum C/D str. DC5]KOC51404.1 hypothetical protein ADU89_13650 [Clostridium botulinum]
MISINRKNFFNPILKCILNLFKYLSVLIIISCFEDIIGFNDDVGFSLGLLLSTSIFFLLLKKEGNSPIKFLKIHKVKFNITIVILMLAITNTIFQLGANEFLQKFIMTRIYNHTQLYWGSIIHLIVLAPLCEEILFRGIIFTKLKNVMPVFLAIIIQGIIFGRFHGALSTHILQTFSGIIFALVYNYTNNLTANILFHSFDNLLLVILNMLPFDFNVNPAICIIISFLCLLVIIMLIKHHNLLYNSKRVRDSEY